MKNEIIFKRQLTTLFLVVTIPLFILLFIVWIQWESFKAGSGAALLTVIVFIAFGIIGTSIYALQHLINFYEDGISFISLRKLGRVFVKWEDVNQIGVSSGESINLAAGRLKLKIYFSEYKDIDSLSNFISSKVFDATSQSPH